MNKFLNMERRIQARVQPSAPETPVSRDSLERLQQRQIEPNSIRPQEQIRYLPIVGEVKREGSGLGLPLIPVEFDGVYFGQNRVSVEERIYERRTDGNGRFLLLVRYKPEDEAQVKNGEVRLTVAGQSRIFRIPTTKYAHEGKMEMQNLLGVEKFKNAFQRIGLEEHTLLRQNQLTLVSIAKINIH